MANTSKRNSNVKYSRILPKRHSDKDIFKVPTKKHRPTYSSRYKQRKMTKVKLTPFLKNERTGRLNPSPGARAIAWGIRSKPGKKVVEKGRETVAEAKQFGKEAAQEYKDIAESAVKGGKEVAREGKRVAELSYKYGKEGAYEGGRVGKLGYKYGKKGVRIYTKELPEEIVKQASRFSEEAPDASSPTAVKNQILSSIPFGGKINWGLGLGSSYARSAAKGVYKANRKLAEPAISRGKVVAEQGKRTAGRLDVIGSSFSKKFAPDSVAKSGLKIGKKMYGYGTTSPYISNIVKKNIKEEGKDIYLAKKWLGGKSEKIKGSKFGKFVGGSEAADKYREAKGKLSYARQHKAASTMKLGKSGAKGTAKFALANANMAAELIAKQDGVLAVLKPLFWSLKLVPFITSAIVPIIVVVITALVALMILMCGWVSLGFLVYFLKTIPCLIVNVFMTIGNAIWFSIYAILTLLVKGFTDIINSMFYFFINPLLTPLNEIWRTMDSWTAIGYLIPDYNSASRLKIVPLGYTAVKGQEGYIYNQTINANPGNVLAYLIPKPMEFNLDASSAFYGMPTGASLIGFFWAIPGVPLYLTDDHGNYMWQTVETGNMAKLKFPVINPFAINEEIVGEEHRDKGIIADYKNINRVVDWWNISWDDKWVGAKGYVPEFSRWVWVDTIAPDGTTVKIKTEVKNNEYGLTGTAIGHWTFVDMFTGFIGTFNKELNDRIVRVDGKAILPQELPSYIFNWLTGDLFGEAATQQAALKDAALQSDYGPKQQIYNINHIPWAFAPDDLDSRLDQAVKYYVKGKGTCVIYNTNPMTTATIQTWPKGGIPGWKWGLPPMGTIVNVVEGGDAFQTTHIFNNTDIRSSDGKYAEGGGALAPDYIFTGEPFFVDQDVMQAMKIGKFADKWDTRSRLWLIYKNINGETVRLAQGDDGNLYPWQQVADLYFKSMAESGIMQMDYSLPGG